MTPPYLQSWMIACGFTALFRVQHSAYRNCSNSWSASVLAVYRKKVLSRRTFTSPSFLSFSRWCERVELGMSSSDWMSPTTSPSGCADSSSCMIRSRGSVPIAESMSAYLATFSALFLIVANRMLRYLQKDGNMSTRASVCIG